MSTVPLQIHAPVPSRGVSERRTTGVTGLAETICATVTAWEVLTAAPCSAAAIESFAMLARRNATDLSALGCGAIEQGLVEVILALDALAAGGLNPHQRERTDHAMAQLRAIGARLLVAGEAQSFGPGEAPFLCSEPCARCAGATACPLLRSR